MKYVGFFIFFITFSSTFAAENLPIVKYPFHPDRGILCDQGTQSPKGHSHTYHNTLYALDLATPKVAEPAGIYASNTGKVVSYSMCLDFNTNCGAGFGNHVKVLSEDGLLVMYAHLDKVFVKTGDHVVAGQLLGVEGNTGLTGENNRHLHFSVHSDWRSNDFDFYRQNLGSLPNSIPFKMNICQRKYSSCNGKPVDVRNIKCRRITGQNEWVNTFN